MDNIFHRNLLCKRVRLGVTYYTITYMHNDIDSNKNDMDYIKNDINLMSLCLLFHFI